MIAQTQAIINIRAALRSHADVSHAETMQRYFKTGPGEYGEGDRFLGVRVPHVRRIARQFRAITLEEVSLLLTSPIHEERLLALVILTLKYPKENPDEQTAIYQLYLDHLTYINNWDLVDISAMYIIGAHLFKRSRDPLYPLAKSDNLWHRRVSIMSTFHFIRKGEFDETLKIAGILVSDSEDLIHKAVGWMLREVGNRDQAVEEDFLKKHFRQMPRTMLRYAIEKFPEALRKQYLSGCIAD